MKRYQRKVTFQYLSVFLVILSIIGFGLLSAYIMTQVPLTDYFILPWTAGRAWLLEGINPYSPQITDLAEVYLEESGFAAELPEVTTLNLPLLSLAFYLPFGLIPYPISRIFWMVILAVSVVFSGFISLRLSEWKLSQLGFWGVMVLTVVWMPSGFSIVTGQLSPIIIALIMASIYLIFNGQGTAAGFMLALTFSSFVDTGLILLFLIILSIVQKQWSVISSFFSGIAFLMLLTWLLLPTWFVDWLSVIINQDLTLASINTPLIGLASLLPGISGFLSVFLHVSFILMAMILLIGSFRKSGRALIFRISSFLVIAYLLNLQNRIVFLLLIAPATFFLLRYLTERWQIVGKVFSVILLLMMGLGSWMLVTPNLDFTSDFAVPMLSIGYPILVLIGLFWIRWWALRIPDLQYRS